MPTADSPDWQETVQLVNSPHSDAPDWQQYIVGPGGVPIVTTPTRQTITRIADWSDSGTAATGTTLSLVISPVNRDTTRVQRRCIRVPSRYRNERWWCHRLDSGYLR